MAKPSKYGADIAKALEAMAAEDDTAPAEEKAPSPPSSVPSPSAGGPSSPAPKEAPKPEVRSDIIGRQDFFEKKLDEVVPDLEDVDTLPYFRIEKGQLDLPILNTGDASSEYVGKLAVDKAALRQKLANKRTQAWQAGFAARNGRAPTDDEYERAYERSLKTAGVDVDRLESELRGRGGAEIWVDMDPDNVRDKIKRQTDTLPERLAAPFYMATTGIDMVYSGGEGPETATYNESTNLGLLDWASRMSFGDMLATTMVASRRQEEVEADPLGHMIKTGATAGLYDLAKVASAWGSQEHLELLAQGHDKFSLVEELGVEDSYIVSIPAKIVSSVDVVFGGSEETYKKIGALGLMLGLSFFDPDVLAGVGTIPKGLATAASKINKATDAGTYLAQKVEPISRYLGYDNSATKLRRAAAFETVEEIAQKGDEALSEGVKQIESAYVGLPPNPTPDQLKAAKDARQAAAKAAGIEAKNAVDAAKKSLKEGLDLPEAEALSVAFTRAVQARIGTTLPIGKATLRATTKAARARKKLEKIYEGVTDAAVKSSQALNTARKAATRKGSKVVNHAAAVAKLDLDRLTHMSMAMTLQDLKTHRKAFRMVGQGVDDLPTLNANYAQDVADKFVEKLEDLEAARRSMMNVTTKASVDKFVETRDAFFEAQATALSLGAATSSKMLDDMITAMESVTKTSAKEAALSYAAVRKRLKGAANKDARDALDKSMKAYTGQLERMAGPASDIRAAKEVMAAVKQTAADLKNGYRAAAQGAQADSNATRLYKAAQQQVKEINASTWGSKPLEVAARTLAAITDPAKAYHGLDSRDIQQTLTNAMQLPKQVEREVSKIMEMAKTPKEAMGLLGLYTDNTISVAGSLINTLDGSLWSRARHVLNTQAGRIRKKGSVDGADLLALRTLAKAFIPHGSEGVAMRTSVNKLVKQTAEFLLENKDATFVETVDYIHRATLLAHGSATDASPRAITYAVMATAQAATIGSAGKHLAKKVGALTPVQAKRMEAMVMAPGAAGEDYMMLLEAFQRMGMDPVKMKQTKALSERTNGVVAILDDVSGEGAFVPWSMLENLAESWSNLEKTTELTKARNSDIILTTFEDTFNKLRRFYATSLVSGLLLPRPRHFFNIFVGNFAQVWSDDSFVAAIKSSSGQVVMETMNFGEAIPGLRGPMAKLRKAMERKLGTSNLLPDATQSFFNPAVSHFFDVKAMPNSTVVKTATGTMTIGELRKAAASNGVLSSFTGTVGLKDTIKGANQVPGKRSALREAVGEAGLDKVLAKSPTVQAAEKWIMENVSGAAEWAKKRGSYHAEVAEMVEQRQRVAYFVDLVANKGFSPEDAATKVRNALYDWNSPMSAIEQRVIGKMLLFWGFQRRALGQGARLLLEPLTVNPSKSAMDRVLETSTGWSYVTGREANSWAKLKDQYRAQKAAKEFIRGDSEGDPELRKVYPWWAGRAGSLQFLGNREMTEHEKEAWAKRGYDRDYMALAMPSFTSLEMIGNWLELTRAIVAPFAVATQSAASGDAAQTAEDLLYAVPKSAKGAAEFGMGYAAESADDYLFGPALEALKTQWFGGPPNYQANNSTLRKPTERFVLSHMPWFFGETYPSAKYEGALVVDPKVKAMYDMAMPISYELANWIDPLIESMEVKEDAIQAIGYLAGKYTGMFAEYAHAPEKHVDQVQKKLREGVGRLTSKEKERTGRLTE